MLHHCAAFASYHEPRGSSNMDVLKCLLAARHERSPAVQALLDCLQDPGFNLQVCICSVGGVGSTELSNFLTRAGLACNLLTDQDNLRHTNAPPGQLAAATRVVYLYGDPLGCVASHYRRRHAYHQALKTSGNPKLDEPSFPASFQAYVDRGDDLFGLEQHLRNWLHTRTPYDVLFVRYERMFDLPVAAAMLTYIAGGAQGQQQQQAAGFCGASGGGGLMTPQQLDGLAAEFAASKRQRASQVTDQQRRAMYVQLAALIDELPPIFVRTADGRRLPLAQGGD